MSNSINEGSYAQYEDFDNYAYNCVKHLMDNDEVVWKLLKYKTPDAWNQPNLTRAQKAALIYAGQDNSADFNVFMDIGQPDVETTETCVIRLSPYSVFPDNRVYGTVSLMFEVYSHYKLNHLGNYKTRVDMITKRFIQVFNGSVVGGIGKLFFDRMGSESNRLENGGQLPFRGRWIIMSNKSP
jgi:hypothetical protein